MKLIIMSRFNNKMWTSKIGIENGDKIIVLGGFYFGNTKEKFDFYLYPPCIKTEGKDIDKIGFTVNKNVREK